MKRLSFVYENIKFSVAEYPFPDTVKFRIHLPFPDKKFADLYNYDIKSEDHYCKNIEVDKTSVALDIIRSEFAEFFDIRVSLAKLFFSGKNSIGFKRRQDYNDNWSWKLNIFKAIIRKYSGIPQFNSFTDPSSRFDVGLNLQCRNRAEAEVLRDYFHQQKIPHLISRSPQEINTRYWNNRSAYRPNIESKFRQPNRAFACYVTNDNYVRLETRLYNRRGVTSLKNKSKLKSFNLENNLSHLGDWDFINEVFWKDAIYLFVPEDRQRITEAYDLKV